MSGGRAVGGPGGAAHVNRTLDSIRGVAALLVVLGHSRFFIQTLDGTTFNQLPVLQRLLLVPSTVAQESVAVFFVLSGYLVGGQVLRQGRTGRFSWSEYGTKRLSRLWTVLLPGLAVTALVTVVVHYVLSPAAVSANGSIGAAPAACNAFFLQESRCGDFGSDVSLWSLSYEFWFYVTFAAAAIAFFAFARRRLLAGAVNVAVLIAATAVFGVHLYLYIPAWLFGVVVAEISNRPQVATRIALRPSRYLALAVGAVGCGMIVTNLVQPSRPVLMLVIGVPAALLTLVASRVGPLLNGRRLVRLTAWLGDWSYSLYVLHAPLLVLLVGVAHEHGLTAGWRLVVGVYVATLVVLPVCWLVARGTERHTMIVRRVMFAGVSTLVRRDRTAERLPLPAESP